MSIVKWSEDKPNPLEVDGEKPGRRDEAVSKNVAVIMDHCYKALTNLKHTGFKEEYGLWLSLVSLSKAVLAAWTVLQNEGLLDLADMLRKDVEELRRPKLVEDGIVEVRYVLRRDAIPEEIEGGKDEVLKKVEGYLSVRYRIREEFKELVKKLIESPTEFRLESLEDPRVKKLVESGLCELYLIPRGCPVADVFWFVGYLPSETNLTAVKEHIDMIDKLAGGLQLPESISADLRTRIDTSKQLLDTLEKSETLGVTCPSCGSSNTRLVATPMDMEGDIHPKYQCLECGKAFQVG